MGWNVLVTARAFWVNGQEAEAALRAVGCEVARTPNAGPVPVTELAPMLKDCDAIVGSSDPYTAQLFALCPRLKIVSRCGVGVDSVDMAAATEAGVIVTNTPGAMTEAVADYTFGLMLAVARRIVEADAAMRGGRWGEYPGPLLHGKTLGLVGVGQIGERVARRAAGFSMRVLAYDPIMSANGLPGVEFVDLDQLVRESDFISLHAPATPETIGMFDASRLAAMKPTAYLINTARGALIDETALLDALRNGTIAGAALDVYGAEPLPADHPLRRSPRTLLSPHNAFNAIEAAQTMSRLSAENIIELIEGRRPKFTCNPAVWDSPSLRAKI